jgi:hypothetical protein
MVCPGNAWIRPFGVPWSKRMSTGRNRVSSEAVCNEFEYGRDLLPRHVELLHDLLDASVLQVLDDGGDGKACALEHPGAAYLAWNALGRPGTGTSQVLPWSNSLTPAYGNSPGGSRRRFTGEFKQQAVRLVLDEGKRVTAVARELDLVLQPAHKARHQTDRAASSCSDIFAGHTVPTVANVGSSFAPAIVLDPCHVARYRGSVDSKLVP